MPFFSSDHARSIEPVDCTEERRSHRTFWNVAYELADEFGPESPPKVRELKQMCKNAQSSFIAFADISWVSIRASAGTKQKVREAIPDRESQEQRKKSHFFRILASQDEGR